LLGERLLDLLQLAGGVRPWGHRYEFRLSLGLFEFVIGAHVNDFSFLLQSQLDVDRLVLHDVLGGVKLNDQLISGIVWHLRVAIAPNMLELESFVQVIRPILGSTLSKSDFRKVVSHFFLIVVSVQSKFIISILLVYKLHQQLPVVSVVVFLELFDLLSF